MTDAPRTPIARIPRRRALAWVFVLSLGVAVAIAGGLAVQMALGRDPALGPKSVAAVAQPAQASPEVPAAPEAVPASPAPVPSPVQSTPS